VFAGLYHLAPEVLDAVKILKPDQGACVRRRSWAGYTINTFEFEFPSFRQGQAQQ
jgi:hypothetical protein